MKTSFNTPLAVSFIGLILMAASLLLSYFSGDSSLEMFQAKPLWVGFGIMYLGAFLFIHAIRKMWKDEKY